MIPTDSGENFLQTSAVLIGFERTGGVFDGSVMEAGYGHNDLYGSAWAAKRWNAHMLLLTGIGRGARAAATSDAKASAVTSADPEGARRPLRAFLELNLETDGRPGPDSIGLRVGLALDAGSVLGREGGVTAR